MAGRASFLARFWALRSMLANAGGALLDWSVVLTCVELLHLPKIVSIAAGLTCGVTLAFFLNKRFAFQDKSDKLGKQAALFAACVAGEIGLHSGLSWILINKLDVPYFIAKMTGDFFIMNLLHIVLLRRIVFPKKSA